MLRKIQYNSPVILTFNLLAFSLLIIDKATGGVLIKYFFTNYKTSFFDPLQYFRFFSYVLGHANWSHFSSNFIVALLVGPMVEEKYGSKALLRMIIFTTLLTGLINTLFFNTAILGASGIVFMLILLSSFANAKTGKVPLTFILVIIIFIGKEVVAGLFSQDNISHFAHILGGLSGGIFGYLINKRRIKKPC